MATALTKHQWHQKQRKAVIAFQGTALKLSSPKPQQYHGLNGGLRLLWELVPPKPQQWPCTPGKGTKALSRPQPLCCRSKSWPRFLRLSPSEQMFSRWYEEQQHQPNVFCEFLRYPAAAGCPCPGSGPGGIQLRCLMHVTQIRASNLWTPVPSQTLLTVQSSKCAALPSSAQVLAQPSSDTGCVWHPLWPQTPHSPFGSCNALGGKCCWCPPGCIMES